MRTAGRRLRTTRLSHVQPNSQWRNYPRPKQQTPARLQSGGGVLETKKQTIVLALGDSNTGFYSHVYKREKGKEPLVSHRKWRWTTCIRRGINLWCNLQVLCQALHVHPLWWLRCNRESHKPLHFEQNKWGDFPRTLSKGSKRGHFCYTCSQSVWSQWFLSQNLPI